MLRLYFFRKPKRRNGKKAAEAADFRRKTYVFHYSPKKRAISIAAVSSESEP